MSLLLTILFIGCSNTDDSTTKGESESLEATKVLNTKDEVNEGDFVYRLVTEKGEYHKNESVKIYAELEYIGNNEEVIIFHAASPFYFYIVEKIRNYEIGYFMDQPLVSTILKKGQPLRYEYSRSGGYSPTDEENYVKFMRSFLEDGFPTGYYVVNGFVDFYVEDTNNNQQDFKIEGQIDFKVKGNR